MTSKAKNVNYSALIKEIMAEHNIVRKNPSVYIEKLKTHLKYFRGDIIYKPGCFPLRTYEGKACYEDAIEFLQRQKPVNELIDNEKLHKACQDHVNDIGPSGICSHDGSDGSNPSDRIERYCEWDLACCENIDFGSSTAEDIVISLIVDDGISERNHRKNLFSADVKFVGVASGPHKDMQHCTVISYVGDIRNLGEPSKHKANIVDELLKHEENKNNGKSISNPYQENDPDAPDDTIGLKIVRTTKIIKGKPTKITKKVYTLADNSLHVVEIMEN